MKLIFFLAVLSLLYFNPATAAAAAPGALSPSKAFIRFMAGIELIDTNHNLDNATKAKKFKQLCSLTGLNAASAIAVIEQYKNRPQEWQTVQTSVIEILQSIKK